MSERGYQIMGLVSASIFLGLLAIQYPLQTTFPIGGDAPRFVAHAQRLFDDPLQEITKTWYPGTIAWLAAWRLALVDWPDRFVWAMTASNIASGVAAGWLMTRLAGPASGAAAMAIWAVMGSMDRHIEDGTLAQLASLPIMIVSLERLMSRAYATAGLGLIVTALFHPFSALVALAAIGLAISCLLWSLPRMAIVERQILRSWIIVIALIGGLGIILLTLKGFSTEYLPREATHVSLENWLMSHMGPFVVLATAGLPILWRMRSLERSSKALLTGLLVVATFLTFNDMFGLGIFVQRWQTYLLLAFTIFAALALLPISRGALPVGWMRMVFVTLLFLAGGAAAWQANARVYAAYESPSRYLRPHPDELAAIAWLQNNLPAKQHILTSNANRHSEWIPLLTSHSLTELSGADPLWKKSGQDLIEALQAAGYTQIVFFTHREGVPDNWRFLPIVFVNGGAKILTVASL